jgi:putative membrane protein
LQTATVAEGHYLQTTTICELPFFKTFLVFHNKLAQFVEGMQPGTRKFLRFLQTWAINTLAVALAVIILRGHIHCENNWDLLLASLLLGILNAFVRPILMFLALPLLIFTLGLFTLVINALLLYFVGFLLAPYFQVDSFGFAFLGALIISVVSIALNVLTGNARVSVKRQHTPKKKSDDDDVIDV